MTASGQSSAATVSAAQPSVGAEMRERDKEVAREDTREVDRENRLRAPVQVEIRSERIDHTVLEDRKNGAQTCRERCTSRCDCDESRIPQRAQRAEIPAARNRRNANIGTRAADVCSNR